LLKNREQEVAGRQARAQRIESLHSKKKEEVNEMLMEKKYLAQLMIEEQEKLIQQKQKRREEIRKMEEDMKLKKEEEKRDKERKMKEFYERRVAEEAAEAKRAEKLVKALERKEREWIERLREAQTIQESAFEQLEGALTKDEFANKSGSSAGGSLNNSPNAKNSTAINDVTTSFSSVAVTTNDQPIRNGIRSSGSSKKKPTAAKKSH